MSNDLSYSIRWLTGLLPGVWSMVHKGAAQWTSPRNKETATTGWWGSFQATLSSPSLPERLKESIEARSKMTMAKLVDAYNAKQQLQQGPLGTPYDPSAAFQWRSLQRYLARYQYKPLTLVPRGWR